MLVWAVARLGAYESILQTTKQALAVDEEARPASRSSIASWVWVLSREEPDDRHNKIGFRCVCDGLP